MIKIIAFILISSVSFAGSYDDYFEDTGTDQEFHDYYDEGGEYNPNPKDVIEKYYDGSNPDNEIPVGAVDAPTGDERWQGYELGSSSSGKVYGEKNTKALMNNMQNGGDIETLGDTFVCVADNNTYSDVNECRNSCSGVCQPYKFRVELSCQKSEELIKVSPVNMFAAATPLRITYNGGTYTTGAVTSVCSNGYMSGNTGYIWNIDNSGISFTLVNQNSPMDIKYSLGQCRDFTNKAFMAYFQDYYRDIGTALEAHVGKLGYIPSHIINSDMSLSINVLTAGSCDKGTLDSSIPNRAAIEKIRDGNLSESEARIIANKDDNYKIVTSGADYKERVCTVSSIPVVMTQSEPVNIYGRSFQLCTDHVLLGRLVKTGNKISVEFRGGNPDSSNIFANCPIDPTAAANGGWFVAETFSVPDTVADVRLDYSIPTGGGCTAGTGTATVISGNVSNNIACPASGGQYPQITYSYSYEYKKDDFSVRNNDGCSSMPSGCKLMTESVCNSDGSECTDTIKNGINTGLNPTKICSSVSTSIDNYLVCSDGDVITAKGSKKSFSSQGGFPIVKRTYSCTSDKGKFDYSSFVNQDKSVSESMTVKDSGDISFSALGVDGKKTTYNTNLTLKDPECMQTCKVKSPITGDDEMIVLDNGTSIKRPNTVTVNGVTKPMEVSSYKSCIQEKDRWSCPLSANETMIADCDCPDDFLDTIVQMKIISGASSDMKCSTK